MKKVVAVVIVLLVVLGLALLFRTMNDTQQASTTQPTESTTQTTTETEKSDTNNNTETETAPAAVPVEITNFAYSPKELTVKKGTKVTWTNKDSVAHTVTKNEGETDGPESPSMEQGATYSYTFDKAGTFGYFCMPHPQMVASVTVTE